jgi:methionine aminotransferase
MSSLAAEHNAINLGQGFPDFPMSEELTELVNKAMKDGFNQYVHMNGYLPLREGVAEKANALYVGSPFLVHFKSRIFHCLFF